MPGQSPSQRAYIALGSNLNDPRAQVEQATSALAQLPGSTLILRSSLYRSKAVGPGDQADYINAVAAIDSELGAEQLLDELQRIERQQGRVRRVRWSARTLDLDILLFGEQQIDSARLKVPHPAMTERNFVLIPLAQIAPTLVLPDGRSIAELANRCGWHDLVELSAAEDGQPAAIPVSLAGELPTEHSP